MAQQKQRKQTILIDGRNIFTHCFQSIQRLQPNFTTGGIRNFMAQQEQRKQPILSMARIFLLTASNQYSAYKLIVRLMS